MPELLVVTPTFYPERLGTPLYVTNAVEWLIERGWTVRILTAQPFYPDFKRHPGYGRGRREDEYRGALIHRLPTVVPRGGRARSRALNEANFLFQGWIAAARRLVRSSMCVLSVTAGTPETVVVGRLLTRAGGRHVALVHDIQSGLAGSLNMASGRLLAADRRLERASLQRADEVHVLSDQMASAVRALGVTRSMHVTPLWPTVARPPAQPIRSLVQFSGNLGRKQGVEQLLPLAHELDRLLPGERLLVRGAGAMSSTVADWIADGTAPPSLELAELVSDAELDIALASSPIHVVPQQAGCADYVMPSKVINALAVGSAVVAAAPPGSALAQLAGLVPGLRCVDPGDTQAMAAEVVNLALDPLLQQLRLKTALAMESMFDRDVLISRLVHSFETPTSPNLSTGVHRSDGS